MEPGPSRRAILLALVLAFSLMGGIVKILGGVIYGSKALFVDAMTCIANLVALVATIHYYRMSLAPPDRDHHFGHLRLGFGGALVSLLAYSFVAGIVVVDLVHTREYTVSIIAPMFATAGFILYVAAIATAKRISYFFSSYAAFTYSELIESATVIAASLGGALYSYYIDYAGAIALTAYIFYEVYDAARDMLYYMSDIAPPQQVIDGIRGIVEKAGFTVESIRARTIARGTYQGELVVAVPETLTVKEVSAVVEEIRREAREKLGVDLTIALKPLPGGKPR